MGGENMCASTRINNDPHVVVVDRRFSSRRPLRILDGTLEQAILDADGLGTLGKASSQTIEL